MAHASTTSGSGTLIRLAEAARLLSVGDTTLKRWTEAGRIHCVRTPGGHRRFLRDEVLLLRGGIAPVDPAAPMAFGGDPRNGEATPDSAGLSAAIDRVASIRACVRDWAEAADILSVSLLQEGCDRPAAGTATSGEVDARAREVETAVARAARPPARPGGVRDAVLASPPPLRNTLGLTLLAAVLEERGFSVRFLGAGVPSSRIVEAIRSARPALVALSVPPAGHMTGDLSGPAFAVASACRETAARLVLAGGAPWPPVCGAVRVLTFADLAAFLDVEGVPAARAS